mmetsp:Transcript_7751/g.17863  ORF Transcript_7751/g.17863 Transcript_7751/m.17863 type:complete len:265 (+) Transcript_7751:560-1354(+)
MIRIQATGEIRKQHVTDLGQLIRSKQLQDFFQFVQEHHLLVAATPRPALEESIQDGRSRVSILLDVLDYAVGKLLVIERNTLGLVQRNQGTDQELQMLLFQGNRESVNNGSQNLQQFTNSIVAFRFVDKAIENIGNGPSDERSMRHELSVNAVKNCLEIVSFTWIFAIEKFHQLKTKLLIHILFGSLGVHFRTHNKAKEELVGYLQVWPSWFQDRLVFFWVKVIGSRRQGTAYISRNTSHQIGHATFGEDLLASWRIDIVNQLQ